METKTQKISRYISSSRAEFQLPVLEVRAHNATVEQWLDRLRYVPIEHMDECYQMAMNAHNTRTPLIPKELLDQWRVISARPGFRDKQQFQEKTCPHHCSSAGWIIVNEDDVLQMDFTSPDYLYSKPCAIHRQQGWRPDPHANPMGPRLTRPEVAERQEPMRVSNTHVEGFTQAAQTRVARRIVEELEPVEEF